ncbi:hypothetical protein BN1708_005771 [Verticillium longisporum]|uniref:Uncharacterized protein n=1 Tax=Verticillium longisporum TaxID=100787 RepID=A0A0G4MDR4_VERLO|nr:hypothetical protein BN1708_005771 [Verticillium longisporum]
MMYQWKTKAFQMAGVPENKKTLGRTFSMPGSDGGSDSPVVGTVSEYLANWNVLNNAHPNETPADRLRREAREADDKYRAAVRKLDELRCNLEENIFLHLRFLERCELDRLKAVKTVVLDFSGTISNVIPTLQSAVDNMMLFQETVQPASDLRYLLENYRTGGFHPKVVVYENYYNKVDEQTANRSERVERAREGVMMCGSVAMGRVMVGAWGEARSCTWFVSGLSNATGSAASRCRGGVSLLRRRLAAAAASRCCGGVFGHTFFRRFVASIRTSVSGRKLCTAAR